MKRYLASLALLLMTYTTNAVAQSAAPEVGTDQAPNPTADVTPGREEMDRQTPRLGSPYQVRAGASAAATFKDDDERSVSYTYWLARAAVPLLDTSLVRVALITEYGLHHASVDGVDTWTPSGDMNLHRMAALPVARFDVSAVSRLVVSAGVIVASDFRHLNSDAVQPSARLLFQRSLSDSLSLFGGAGVSRQFLEVAPFPLLGVVWAPTAVPFRLDLMVPQGLRAAWEAASWFELAAVAQYEGFVWQVAQNDGVPEHLVKNATVTTGLAALTKFTPALALELSGGVSVFQRTSLRTDTEELSGPLEPGAPFAQVSLMLRP